MEFSYSLVLIAATIAPEKSSFWCFYLLFLSLSVLYTLHFFFYLFSHWVRYDSATPWTAAHQAPCPSLSSGVCSNLCLLSQWCYLTISSSVAPFSSCPQSFPASGSFSVSQLFTSGGQSIEASASASVLSINILGLVSFRINWFVFLTVQGTLKSLLQYNLKASILWRSAFFMVQLSHPYMTTAKTIALTILVTLMITTQSLSYAKNSTSFLNF